MLFLLIILFIFVFNFVSSFFFLFKFTFSFLCLLVFYFSSFFLFFSFLFLFSFHIAFPTEICTLKYKNVLLTQLPFHLPNFFPPSLGPLGIQRILSQLTRIGFSFATSLIYSSSSSSVVSSATSSSSFILSPFLRLSSGIHYTI